MKDLIDLIGDGTQYNELRPHIFEDGMTFCVRCGKPKEEIEDDTEACSRSKQGNIEFYAESAKEMASMDRDIQTGTKSTPNDQRKKEH